MLDRLRHWLGLSRPLPEVTDAQWARVEATLPFLDYLEPSDRPRLRQMALEFLACKQFHGAHDFELRDDMLLSIALQASLPVLNIGLDAYKGWVGVVVYAGDFIIPRREYDEAGVVHEYDVEALGEAWEGGPVLLSWFEGEAQPFGVKRGDPRICAQARHGKRQRRWFAAAQARHGARALGRRLLQRL